MKGPLGLLVDSESRAVGARPNGQRDCLVPSARLRAVRGNSSGPLRIDHEVDATEWAHWVTSLKGSVFHTTSWARYQCLRYPGLQPVFARWVGADEEPVAIAVGHIRRGPRPFERSVSRVSFASPPAAIDELPSMEELELWARRQGAAELDLGPLDAAGRSWGDATVSRPTEWVEFLIDPGDEREIWRRIHKRPRRAIRRAERVGVSVECAGAEGAETFARLYLNTVTRLRQRKGVTIEDLGGRACVALAELLASGAAKIYLAVLKGRPIAGCIFGVAGDRAYYMLNGSTTEGLDAGATPLIFLEALADMTHSDCSVVSLGGVPAGAADHRSIDHGLYEFKMGFGAEPVPCSAGSVRISPWRLGLIRAARMVQEAAGRNRRSPSPLQKRRVRIPSMRGCP